MRINHDLKEAKDLAEKKEREVQFLNGENKRLESEISEIKELLGICESKDPTDKDRAHLKTLVRKLKQRNDQLTDE